MNPVFSAPDQAIIRTASKAQDYVIFDPCVVVFRAKVAAIPTSNYFNITYNTVSVGAHTAIKIGMVVLISTTADHTTFLWKGRVAAAATASVVPINEASLPLATSYFVTVVSSYEVLPRVRSGSLVDGRVAYQNLPPTITGVPSAKVVESAVTGSFSYVALGQAVASGATISSYLWDIPGATYTVGSASTATITVTMPAGSHTWGRLTVTDSIGTPQWMAFQLIVQDPSNPTLATLAIDSLRLNRTINGHHASCRAYQGVAVTAVMNGTRAVIVSRRSYAGGAVAMDNVAFVGYLSKEANNTPSINDTSVTFDIAGIWERAGQLPMNPIAVRDVAAPTRWDEMNLPTAQRVVTHVLARYSTVLNLCSLNLDTTANTWYGGDMDMNATSLGDAVAQVLSEINAVLSQNPSGELYLRRDLRFTSAAVRVAADVAWTLDNRDLRELSISYPHDERTGRIVVGFRGYQTSRTTSKGGKAVAPTVTLGTSPATQTRGNQLMQADQTEAQLLTEAKERSGNLLASENPEFEASLRVRAGLSYWTPSVHQWIQINLLPALTTRGRTVSVRVLVESVEISYDNRNGTHDVSVTLLPETRGDPAMVVASLTPNVSSLDMFVTPPQYAYGGSYGGSSSLNIPDLGTTRPFDRGDMGGIGNPMPPDQSWTEAQYNVTGDCRTVPLAFYSGTNVAAGFVSTLGASYEITLSGSAKIANGAQTIFLQDTFPTIWNSALSFVGLTSNGGSIYDATFTAGLGIFNIAVDIVDAGSSLLCAYLVSATNNTVYQHRRCDGALIGGSGSGASLSVQVKQLGLEGSAAGVICRITIDPVIPVTGNEIYADAFYTWKKNADGERIDVTFNASGGFRIQNAAIAVPPPYDPSGRYPASWTGDGQNPLLKFLDSNYNDNETLLLYAKICGAGAGTS